MFFHVFFPSHKRSLLQCFSLFLPGGIGPTAGVVPREFNTCRVVSTTNRCRSAQNILTCLPCVICTCNMQYQDVSSTVISRNLPVFFLLDLWKFFSYGKALLVVKGIQQGCIFLGFTQKCLLLGQTTSSMHGQSARGPQQKMRSP